MIGLGAVVCFFIFCKLSFCAPVENSVNSSYHEVDAFFNENVVLKCDSNTDDEHVFFYWHVEKTNNLIGPYNIKFDDKKYDYEILDGNLTIRCVTPSDAGLYNCVSRGVKKPSNTRITTVKVIGTGEWEEMFEHDPKVNAFRVVIAVTSVVIFCAFMYVAYRLWTDRYKYPSYLEELNDEPAEEDADSTDEIFRAPGTSRTNNYRDFEDASGISTDFNSILEAAKTRSHK